MKDNKKGKVFLVGAGPGDPGLLTLKGKDCLALADVVIYDNLANRTFLQYADPGAELIYVGKSGGCHTMNQDQINRLIVEMALKNKTIVRLKGGDPYIFGRGGEEAQELIEAGIEYEVVPGITSAIAVPAYAGIPLTHRDYTSTVAFITGHEDPLKEKSSITWDKLATGVGTLVFLMGVGNLPSIAQSLMKNGRSPATPVAVIRKGTLNEQKTLTGTLENIADLALSNKVKPPAIIVVGEVVSLKNQLDWFEKRPLFGRRIVVTRAREQASEFIAKLSALGADCIEFPTIEIAPPDSWDQLDRTIEALEEYQWLLFTSVNGAKWFLNRLEMSGKDVRDLKGLKIAAIGPKTAEIWSKVGIKPDLIPSEYRAEGVIKSFEKWETKGIKILLPRASKAREILPEELKKMGAKVDVVPAYKTIKPDYDTTKVIELLENNAIDMVTFTSSSTVTNFVEMFEKKGSLNKLIKKVSIACIGPITAKTAEQNGLLTSIMPAEYTIEALTESIIDYFSELKKTTLFVDKGGQ
jgi:uroporphyrinogen III methyltransferase/synthase